MLIYSIPSISQIFGEYSLPHTTSIDVLKKYIGQRVKIPSGYKEVSYNSLKFEGFGGYENEIYKIEDVSINSKQIKLVLRSQSSGKKITPKINISKTPDFKNMTSCESFFLYDKFNRYIEECKSKINTHHFLNITGDTVAVVSDVTIDEKLIKGVPQTTYTIKTLLHNGFYNKFKCQLNNAEEYCKNFGIPILNFQNDTVAKVIGCVIKKDILGEICEYQIRTTYDNSIFNTSIKNAKNICIPIGKELTHPKVNTKYKIVGIEFKDNKTKYKVLNLTSNKLATYTKTEIDKKDVFNDDLSGRYISILTKVEKPSNSSIRYGKTKTIENSDNITQYSYIDNVIDILILGNSEQFSFILKNISDNTIKVIWDEAVFIDFDGNSSKIMHIGTKYSQRESSQSPTTIIKGAKIEDIAVPTCNVRYSSYLKKWVSDSMYPATPNLSPGKLQLMLPIQIKGITNEYTFIFDVKYRYNHPERLNMQ